MNEMRNDYSQFMQLGLEFPPAGVKFSYFKPEGIDPLESDVRMSWCEMLRMAQYENRSFYFSKAHTETCVGKILLGMEDMAPFAEAGEIGKRLGMFEEPRCNQHFYQFVPKLAKGTTNYVLFSALDKLTFDPDVLVVAAKPEQAEIVMRAMTYSTGEMYQSCCTPVMGCAWLMLQPYITGKVNFIVPALVHGLHGRQLYPADTLLIGIPYQWLPTMITNLSRMKHHLEGHKDKEHYYAEFGGIIADLSERSKNP